MDGYQIAMTGTFVGYLGLLLFIGWLGDRRHGKGYADFVTADKSMGPWTTALSSAASAESVWVMLGLSGLGYWKGVAAFWAALGCILGFAFNAVFVMVRMRRDSARLGALTLSDYLEARVGDRSRWLRVWSAVLIVFFMSVYVVAQFTGAGALMQEMEVFGGGTPYWAGVVVGAVVDGLYVLTGGYAAVCWTDTLQGLLMALVMIGLPAYAVVEAGGFSGIAQALAGTDLILWTTVDGVAWAGLGFAASQLAIGLGYPGMPHVVVRYITVRDDRAAVAAGWITVGWSVIVLVGSPLLGLAGRALFPAVADFNPDCLAAGHEAQKCAEQFLPFFAREFLHPILAGVVLAAVTAAIMSTADSQLMYAATALINDVWLRLRPGAARPGDRTLIIATRVVVIVLTLAAMILALVKLRLIYTFVLFAWGALGAAFTPVVLLALYWRGLTRTGALACMVVGPVVVILWKVLELPIYELIPGVVAGTAAAILGSQLTRRRELSAARPHPRRREGV